MNIKSAIEIRKKVHRAINELNKVPEHLMAIPLGLHIDGYIEILKEINAEIEVNHCLTLIETEVYSNANSYNEIDAVKYQAADIWSNFFVNDYENELDPMRALTDSAHPWYLLIESAIDSRVIDAKQICCLMYEIQLICKNLDALKYGIRQLCGVLEKQDIDNVDDVKKNKRTMKVTTDVLMELLNKAGINENNSDKTKIAKLIAYITGFSENTIRQRITNREELTSKHKDAVEKVNKLLSELNTGTSIKYNKNR